MSANAHGTRGHRSAIKIISLARNEGVIDRARGAVLGAFSASGISRSELARRLGVSRPYVTNMLKGENLTVHQMARIFDACGFELCFYRTVREW